MLLDGITPARRLTDVSADAAAAIWQAPPQRWATCG